MTVPLVPAPLGPTRARRLAVGVGLVATVALVVMTVLVWVRTGFRFSGGYTPLIVPITLGAALAYAGTGAVILLRRSETRIGWILAAMGLLIAAIYLGFSIAAAPGTPLDVPDSTAASAGLISAGVLSPAGATLAILFGLIFPTDHLIAPRWRWGIVLSVTGAVLSALGNLLRPGPILFVPEIDNPLVAGGSAAIGTILLVTGIALLAAGAALAAASLLLRYGEAGGETRRQIRLVVAAGIAMAALYVTFLAFSVVGIRGTARDVVFVLLSVTLLLSPIAILVAIARYRLYDIDRLVGRGFVYGGLLALLAGLYAASMRLFTALSAGLLGESSEVALVITTLVLATTFTPIKTRLEAIVKGWDADDGAAGPGTAAGPGSAADSGSAADPAARGPATTSALLDPATREAMRQIVREVIAEEQRGDPRAE